MVILPLPRFWLGGMVGFVLRQMKLGALAWCFSPQIKPGERATTSELAPCVESIVGEASIAAVNCQSVSHGGGGLVAVIGRGGAVRCGTVRNTVYERMRVRGERAVQRRVQRGAKPKMPDAWNNYSGV